MVLLLQVSVDTLKKEKPEDNSAQFEKNDNRTLDEIIGWLMDLVIFQVSVQHVTVKDVLVIVS